MRILTLNSSVHGDKGNTHLVATALNRGFKEAGAETEYIFLKTLDIQPCKACFKCWTFTPGRCIINDSMQGILDKMHQANIVVFASPLYFFSWSGLMKNFIDRMIPLIKPWMITQPNNDNTTTHPLRYSNQFKAILLSTCAFPEVEHFKSLEATFKQMCQAVGWQHIGSILRPAAELLRVPMMQIMLNWYYDAIVNAGKEFALNNEISEETQSIINRDLSPNGYSEYRKTINDHWFNILKKGGHDITDYPKELDDLKEEEKIHEAAPVDHSDELEAAGYGKFKLSDFKGKVVVLVSGPQREEKYCEQILKDIMVQFMSSEHICLINVINVSTVIPRMKPMTIGNMERLYNDSLRNIRMWYAFNKHELPMNMKNRVLFCPDWSGNAALKYSKAIAADPEVISTVLISHEGKIIKEFTGSVVTRDMVDTITSLLRF